VKNEFDVVIVGGGASGLFAAIPLIRSGYSVAIVEKGRWRESSPYDNDELYTYVDQREWPDPAREFSVVDFGDASSLTTHRMGQSYGYVGGGTITYAGVSERFRLADFVKRTSHGDIDDANTADWPVGFYDELEPYYAIAEGLLGVSGDSSLDPTAPPRSNKLFPPLAYHEINLQMISAAKSLGWNPYPVPLAISSVYNPATHRTWCVSSGLCSGYRCIWNSKGSADTIFRSQVEGAANYKIFTNHVALKIETCFEGASVSAVRILNRQTRAVSTLAARRVLLAAGGVLSPSLLLRSKDRFHPDGLSNGNDLVGRNLMFHIEGQKGAYFKGDFAREKFNNVKKVMVADHYFGNDRSSSNHVTIQAGTKTGPIRFAIKKQGWGLDYLRDMYANYMNHYEFQVMVEDLPRECNRVTLDETRLDVDGLACSKITHRYHPMDGLALIDAFDLADRWIRQMNGTAVTNPEAALLQWKSAGCRTPPPWIPVGFHLMGTLRMGTDPLTSVIDRDCQSHSVKGLFVVDSSVFPTSAGVNPTLTLQANALRVADKIIQSDGKR